MMVDADDLLATQRDLRRILLDHTSVVDWPSARDLAARLLLYLDDPTRCWQLSVEWIRTAFGVDRADAGRATPAHALYHPAWVEARAKDIDVASLRGLVVNNQAGAASMLWRSTRPLVFPEVAQDVRFETRTREGLVATGTVSKIAIAVRHKGLCLGLLCADQTVGELPWSSDLLDRFELIGTTVLPPILAASLRFGADATILYCNDAITNLTPAELNVANLAARGFSYKQIARALNRSFSTVDHQLRSIRRKTGAANHAQLASYLSVLRLRTLDGQDVDRESSR